MIKRIAVGALITTGAFAQPSMVEEKMKAEAHAMMVYSIDSAQVSTLTGAPYSAEETNTTTQTLFDGNRIVNASTTKVYRDSQGRTRVERTLGNIGAVPAGQPSVSVTINDPVAGVHYSLDSASRTAFKSVTGSGNEAEAMARLKKLTDEVQASTTTVTKARTAESGNFTFTTSSGAVAFKSTGKREDLGGSNMAGVPVTGSKTTTVIPAGTMGNDRDITITEERWYSPDLKMNIMTKRSDPRMGETVFQVNNLTRTNPDPSLFQVPSDYTTKEGPRPGFKMTTDMTKE